MVFRPARRKPVDHGHIRAQRRYRQQPDRLTLLAVADDPAMDMTGQRPGADGRAGDGGADHKALRGQDAAHQVHHRRLAAEQMRATGDVEKKTVRRIERHQRSETVTPLGDGVQRIRVRSLIGIIDLHVRADGAGIGERQVDREAKMRGRIIERGNPQHVVLPGNDNAGLVNRSLT